MTTDGATMSARHERVEEVMAKLLDAYPHAEVGAIGRTGRPLPVPDGIARTTHTVLGDHQTGLHLVAPHDRARIIEQFRQIREGEHNGASEVHVQSVAGRTARSFLLDLGERYGVMLRIFVEDGESEAHPVSLPDLHPVAPRFGRTRRDDLGRIIEVDEGVCAMTGFDTESLVSDDPLGFIHPDDHDQAIQNWLEMMSMPPGEPARWRGRHRHADGSWLWVEFTNYIDLTVPGALVVVSEMVDISEEMRATEEVWASRELLQRLTEALPLGVLQIDDRRVVAYTNDRLHDIVGVPRRSTFAEQLETVVDEDRPRLEAAVDQVLAGDSAADLEVRLRPPSDVGDLCCNIALRAVRDRSDRIAGAIVCVSDVTESTTLRRELEVRASFDLLTDCYNRGSVVTALEQTLQDEDSRGTAVVFVDLDDFKPVNDRYGHAVGDELLRAVAERVRRTVRPDDLVGRIGGDEFLVVCPSMTGPEAALAVGRRIRLALAEDILLARATIQICASIGVAWTRRGPADALVAAADEAMYRSKAMGTGEPVLAGPIDGPIDRDDAPMARPSVR